VYTDYQGLVDGIAAGKDKTCGPKQAYSEVWRELWAAIEDVGPDQVRFLKVPAHVNPDNLPRGSEAWLNAVGNGLADVWAKAGAREHPQPAVPDQPARRKLDSFVHQVCTWIGRRAALANQEPRDNTGKASASHARRTHSRSLHLAHDVSPLAGSSGWWFCKCCGKRATDEARLSRQWCRGVGQVLAGMHRSHTPLAV